VRATLIVFIFFIILGFTSSSFEKSGMIYQKQEITASGCFFIWSRYNAEL